MIQDWQDGMLSDSIAQHMVGCLFLMFGAMHFIYYINRSIATKVD